MGDYRVQFHLWPGCILFSRKWDVAIVKIGFFGGIAMRAIRWASYALSLLFFASAIAICVSLKRFAERHGITEFGAVVRAVGYVALGIVCSWWGWRNRGRSASPKDS